MQLLWSLQPGGIGPIIQLRRHIGQLGFPEQKILLPARWQQRGFCFDREREGRDAILKGSGLFENTTHRAAPFPWRKAGAQLAFSSPMEAVGRAVILLIWGADIDKASRFREAKRTTAISGESKGSGTQTEVLS